MFLAGDKLQEIAFHSQDQWVKAESSLEIAGLIHRPALNKIKQIEVSNLLKEASKIKDIRQDKLNVDLFKPHEQIKNEDVLDKDYKPKVSNLLK